MKKLYSILTVLSVMGMANAQGLSGEDEIRDLFLDEPQLAEPNERVQAAPISDAKLPNHLKTRAVLRSYLSLGFIEQNFNQLETGEMSTRGIEAAAAIEYAASSNVILNTSPFLAYTTGTYDNAVNTGDVEMTSFGLRQLAYYEIQTADVLWRPFVGVGLGYGVLQRESLVSSAEDEYFRDLFYEASAGLEIQLGAFVPRIGFVYRSFKPDDKETSGTGRGTLTAANSEDFSSVALQLGLGFIF